MLLLGRSYLYITCRNCLNCQQCNMEQRVRALECHFYSIPNAISYLEDYYKSNGESILTLDESLRKFLNGNDFRAAEDDYRSNIAPDTVNGYNILEMDIEIFNLQQN